jgi:hypothetical protein
MPYVITMDKKNIKVRSILILGATGATGKLLLEQLLESGHRVTAIVRSSSTLPAHLADHENLKTLKASVLDLGKDELQEIVKDCCAIASCLGHNLTIKGIFGRPRKLVTQAVSRVCQAVKANNPAIPVKFILMNTTGNRNRDLKEPYSFGDRLVLSLVRLLIPPQSDNEGAANYLRKEIGQNNKLIHWSAVRPDTLIDEEKVTAYQVFPSIVRSPVFKAGQTSRINVAHFMAHLITDENTWIKWKGQMPVIYNTL